MLSSRGSGTGCRDDKVAAGPVAHDQPGGAQHRKRALDRAVPSLVPSGQVLLAGKPAAALVLPAGNRRLYLGENVQVCRHLPATPAVAAGPCPGCLPVPPWPGTVVADLAGSRTGAIQLSHQDPLPQRKPR